MTATPDQPTATDTAREGLRAAAIAERLASPEMVEAVARAIDDQQTTSRFEYKRRVGYVGRRSLASAALDVVARELGVPDSLDLLLAAPPDAEASAGTEAVLAAVLAAHEHIGDGWRCSCGTPLPTRRLKDFHAHVAAMQAAALHAGGSHEGGGGGE